MTGSFTTCDTPTAASFELHPRVHVQRTIEKFGWTLECAAINDPL